MLNTCISVLWLYDKGIQLSALCCSTGDRITVTQVSTAQSSNSAKNFLFLVDSALLTEGDFVTFGHLSGEKLVPGGRYRQPDSEYQYIVSAI